MMARVFVAVLALAAIASAVWQMEQGKAGITATSLELGPTPVTVWRSGQTDPAPAVVIAHGFAGSRQLMEPFAVTLARNGYVAVSFDFLGHGRNRAPLAGDVTREEGATRALQSELAKVIAWARSAPGTDGRVAVLGHSMASDIIVRQAVADPTISATIAVSMFSRQVTRDAPRNLLMITGAWEGFLARASLDTLSLSVEGTPEFARTYGTHADGTARRAVLAGNVEHVGVLYSRDSMAEALGWLDATFGRSASGYLEVRGPWIVLLLTGIVALAWPLSALLPRIPQAAPPAPLRVRTRLGIAVAPAGLTPLILWPMPTDFLPVLVADYLALHFAVYGLLTAVLLAWANPARPIWPIWPAWPGWAFVRTLVLAIVAVAAYGTIAIGLALDTYVASFLPHAGRAGVLAALTLGAVVYTLADSRLVARPGAGWWLGPFTKLCFLLSLGAAIALDLEDLFFLAIIAPVILLFFLIYGLIARWVTRATGHPAVAGMANGLAFGCALGVTFPMLAT